MGAAAVLAFAVTALWQTGRLSKETESPDRVTQADRRESSALGAENRLVTAVKRILRRRRGKGRAVRVGLFAKELYKIFVMERAWLLLLLFALLQWNSYREMTAAFT